MAMAPPCAHKNLVLLAEPPDKLQCRYCHLTITRQELDGGYCPECYEVYGKKRTDFEKVVSKENGTTRYRCEDCGAIIETSS